jgi:prophage tail gpP-like protein
MLQIVLIVDKKEFTHFSNVDVNLKLDSVASSFSFDGYFDIQDRILEKLFKPLSYLPCEVWAKDLDNGINEKLITGTILNQALSIQRNKQLTGVSGYSKTGVFEDCNIPISSYPLQFDGLGLDKIAKKLCDDFNIQLKIFDNARKDAAKPFELTKAQPTESIKQFLSNIAMNRNITVAHDNFGRLLLYKVEGKVPPKFKINENDIGVISVSINPNGQRVHSDITVIKQASTKNQNEGQTTITSPFVEPGVKRPKVQIFQHGAQTDTKLAATQMVCTEAKNFPITIELEGWTFQNKIARAGFYIELTAPSIFLETTKLVLQNVQFSLNPEKGKTMTLTAVLPCVYTGVLPKKSPFK